MNKNKKTTKAIKSFYLPVHTVTHRFHIHLAGTWSPSLSCRSNKTTINI